MVGFEVEIGGDDPAGGAVDIAGHGNGFEENFGACDGGADVEDDAAFVEVGDVLGIDEEVSTGAASFCGAVEIRMLVDDVGADAHVDSEGDVVLMASGDERDFRMLEDDRVIEVEAFFDCAAEVAVADELSQGLSETDETMLAFEQGGVDVAELAGHAELALRQGVGDVLAGLADEGQFEVVNCTGAIGAQQRDGTSSDQVDQDQSQTVFNEMSAGKPDNRSACTDGKDDVFGQLVQDVFLFGSKGYGGGEGTLRIGKVFELNFIDSIGDGIGLYLIRIEDWKFSMVLHRQAPFYYRPRLWTVL